MASYTQEDVNRKLMKKIICNFGGVYKVSPETAKRRHITRMIMLVRWTFLLYCQRHPRCNELPLEGFGHGLQRATICMWMEEPYMQLYKTNGQDAILAQYSLDTLKELYKYIKGLS